MPSLQSCKRKLQPSPEPLQGSPTCQPCPSKRHSCFKGKKSDTSAEKTPSSLHRGVGGSPAGRFGGSGHAGRVCRPGRRGPRRKKGEGDRLPGPLGIGRATLGPRRVAGGAAVREIRLGVPGRGRTLLGGAPEGWVADATASRLRGSYTRMSTFME